MSHLFKRFSRDITGLIWLSMGIFFALALLSYNPTDPSLNSIGRSLAVKNYCGYFGSFLSDIFYQLFGLCAWVFVAGCFRSAVRNFRGENPPKGALRFVWLVLLVITISSLFSLYWPTKTLFHNQVLAGGFFGNLISRTLIAGFNSAGVAVILWTVLAALIVFYTEKPIKELLAWPLGLMKPIRSGFAFIGSKLSGKWNEFSENMFALVNEKAQPQMRVATANAAPAKNAQTMKEPEEKKGLFSLKKFAAKDADKALAKFLPIEKEEVEQAELDEAIEDFEKVRITAEPGDKSEGDVAKPRKRIVELKKKIQRRIENWELPKLDLLDDPPYNRKRVDEKEIRAKADILIHKLKQFDVEGVVMDAKPGPAVTLFEFKPNSDVKISKITELADDLSLALSAESVRIIAPIPGRDVVGIETSNTHRESVYLKDILASEMFWEDKMYLPITMGCEADGTQKVVDLRKMPHLMVAGTTGSGKSVFVVSLLTGLLFRHSPKTLRLILIDPKQVDLAAFARVPHLLMPAIRDTKKAISSLRWAIKEMDKRYRSMSKFKARDLEGFNAAVEKLTKVEVAEHDQYHTDMGSRAPLDSYYFTPQPYIVVVCEEFGDLMAVDKQNVEQCVVRLAQMARACGIHLILAMQSPRKDVVTGLIKTNIPGRISFKVASKMDSRIIIDESGAERLLARGDMLFVSPATSKPVRNHGPWVTDAEIAKVTEHWYSQAEPEFDPAAMRALEGYAGSTPGAEGMEGGEGDMDGGGEEADDMYDEIVAFISTQKEISTSFIQRRFRLGYPRAARLIEILESQGVVGPANGSKPRQVLINELK